MFTVVAVRPSSRLTRLPTRRSLRVPARSPGHPGSPGTQVIASDCVADSDGDRDGDRDGDCADLLITMVHVNAVGHRATALMLASEKAHADCIGALIAAGARR